MNEVRTIKVKGTEPLLWTEQEANAICKLNQEALKQRIDELEVGIMNEPDMQRMLEMEETLKELKEFVE